jgi:hypothetical protein
MNDYKKIIEESLQQFTPNHIKMHKINEHFILDIDYDIIVNGIIDNLESNGYTVNSKHQ